MKLFFGLVGVVVLALSGCTGSNSASCLDGTCSDPARPFCDADGALSGTPGLCVSVDCTPNAFQMCRGDDAVVCNADGTNYDVKQCEAGCGPAGCNKVGGCTANESVCGANDTLFMCDADGQQLMKIQDCQYGCDMDHCNACSPSTTFCSGDDLVMCTAGGDISNPMTCQFGCQAMACNECTPSTTFCEGSNAVTCTAGGKRGASQTCGAAGCQGGVCNTCTPNTTTCQGDNLVVCNGGGTVQSITACALGCGTTGSTHCKALVPLFGVPVPSGTLPDLRIDNTATLDITNCAALDVKLTLGATTTSVPSNQISVVSQSGGPPICVVKYGTVTIVDPFVLTAVSSAVPGHVLSLEATGDVTIGGKIQFFAPAMGPVPGTNAATIGTNAAGKYTAAGAGGGGAAFAGGNGGKCTACSGGLDLNGGSGGPAYAFANVLFSGSKGGSVTMGGTTLAYGGTGGGGLHLVSLTKVTLAATAVVNLNGTGGAGPNLNAGNLTAGGGGAGGTLVVEAPIINISAGAIATANGGGGAGGSFYFTVDGSGANIPHHYNGQAGQLSATRAVGGDVANTSFGDGGYEADGTTTPSANGQPSDSGAATVDGGGGGGSRGFIVLRGRTTTNVMITFGAVISPAPMTGTVVAQ